MKRISTLAALFGVVAVSIVFGMIVGGRLNAPAIMHAASPAAMGAFPAATKAPERTVALPDFSEIAQDALPAVVGVQNTSFDKSGGGGEGDDGEGESPDDPLFRFFFGYPNGQSPRAHPQLSPRQQPQRRVSSGSGFIITPDGYILTNNHVVEGATRLQVTLDTGEKYSATVVGTDPMIDLGLIKIDPKGKKLQTLPLGDSDALKVGQWVMAIGNPFELERTVTVGVVSGKRRQVGNGNTIPGLANFIQTDAAINFGNSGGPLIDGQGRVVGINTMIQRGELAEGIGFAIPINEARRAAEELRAGGSVKRGYLGIAMNPTGIDDNAKKYYKLPDNNGVIVADVTPKGPAAVAGLHPGDVIRKIDGNSVKDNQDLLAMIASRKPGESVRLDVLRRGEMTKIDVKLASRPVTFGSGEDENETKPDDESTTPSSAEGLGIKVQAIPQFVRSQLKMEAEAPGVLIASVDPESDAAEQGLTQREIVTAVDDKKISTVGEWNRIVNALKPGDTVKLDVTQFLDRAGTQRNEIIFLTVPQAKSK
jgi:serine protease Do